MIINKMFEYLKSAGFEHIIRAKLKENAGIPPSDETQIFPVIRYVDVWLSPEGEFKYHVFDQWPHGEKTAGLISGTELMKVETMAAHKAGLVLSEDKIWVRENIPGERLQEA